MQHRIRRRLSYANVIATVALFMALGGVSYAAATAAKNSVKSSSIKDGQVKTADLAKNAVTSPKIKDGQVKTADLAAGAVTASKLAPALTTDLNDAATVGGKSATALQTSAFQAKQGAALTLTGTEQAAATLALPTSGTYVVTFSVKLLASDPSSSTALANIDVFLKAGATAIITQQALFNTDVAVFIIHTGEESITRQEVITTTGPATLTLGGNTHFGNAATTTQIAQGVVTALQIGSATGATIVP